RFCREIGSPAVAGSRCSASKRAHLAAITCAAAKLALWAIRPSPRPCQKGARRANRLVARALSKCALQAAANSPGLPSPRPPRGRRRRDERQPNRLRFLFEPGRDVDGVAENRELEPRLVADCPAERLASVQA